jgi:hypothetical protein
MQTVVEYLERAQHFEQMAAEAEDGESKQLLLAQGEGYRMLAARRADQIGVLLPTLARYNWPRRLLTDLGNLPGKELPPSPALPPLFQLVFKPCLLQEEIDNQASKPSVLNLKVINFAVSMGGFVMRYFGRDRRRLLRLLCSRTPTMIGHDADAEYPCNLSLAFAELRHFLGLMELGSDFLR